MPQLVLAALGIAGLWLAAKAVKSLTAEKPHGAAVKNDGREQIVKLRQDPRTGIYRPEDKTGAGN